jgi:hypothetical protein
MKTGLLTGFSERYSQEDPNKEFGIMLNYNVEKFKIMESLPYVFRNSTYIFFTSLTDLISYLFNGITININRAYLSEAEFDVLYDADYINGLFSEKLEWVNN